jgi:hypothetical protein
MDVEDGIKAWLPVETALVVVVSRPNDASEISAMYQAVNHVEAS